MSLISTDRLEFLEFRFMVRLLDKLGDADRRLTRQDRLLGLRLSGAESCPATHAKPMIIAMIAPQKRPQIPYFTFAAVCGFIDKTSSKNDMFATDGQGREQGSGADPFHY